jgi:hypothetical protein
MTTEPELLPLQLPTYLGEKPESLPASQWRWEQSHSLRKAGAEAKETQVQELVSKGSQKL